jgi:hypothetical protein
MTAAIIDRPPGIFTNMLGFRPSVAGARLEGGSSSWLLNEVLRLTIQAASAGGAVWSGVVSGPTLGLLGSRGRVSPVARAQEMAEFVTRQMGFPIAGLSDVLNVERKTIYDWLKGTDATSQTSERLRLFMEVVKHEEEGSLRYFHRFWKRTIPGIGSLHEELTADTLDAGRIKAALDALRPAVERSISYDANRKRVQWDNASVADFSPDSLEAVAPE